MKKSQLPTLAIRNAGESASQKVRSSIPPKLRFDVLQKIKLKHKA